MDRGIIYGWKCSGFWIISEKGKVLSWTTFRNLTAEEPIDRGVQERINDYHGSMEDLLGSNDC